MTHFKRYFWWYLPLAIWVIYELVALASRLKDGAIECCIPTLSQLVWWGYDRFQYLPYIVAAVFGVLYWHFFLARKRNPPDASGT